MHFAVFPIISLFRRFGTAGHDIGNFVAEVLPNIIRGNLCIFDGIVKEPGGYNRLMAAHFLQNQGNADRVGDEGHATGFSALVLVGASGEANSFVYQRDGDGSILYPVGRLPSA
jgi:hypothetical protein